MRPIHRSSHVTGGLSTNVSRMASAIGTSTVCAQYRMTTTSTQQANATHRRSVFDVSSIRRTHSWGRVAQAQRGKGLRVNCVKAESKQAFCRNRTNDPGERALPTHTLRL
jgi:hypothetical protein